VLISQACFRIVSIKYSTFILIKELSETNTKGRIYSLTGSQFARSLVNFWFFERISVGFLGYTREITSFLSQSLDDKSSACYCYCFYLLAGKFGLYIYTIVDRSRLIITTKLVRCIGWVFLFV